jgi:uncharacterized protein (DUF1800 family)
MGRGDLPEELKREVKRRTRAAATGVIGARVVRAVHAEQQLREVMIDFWSNHFSVYARKGPIGAALPHYQQQVIERFALGRFGELLRATARSPAMLFYLDNWMSTAPPESTRRRSPRRSTGINENYARELLELHTLGIDGGYSQDDVRDVARTFTGWTLESRRRPRFVYRDRLHDPGRKTVLGERVPGHGREEGEWLLERLARRPETAHFVSRKLVARFVSDDPPATLVERATRRFLDTEGDIAKVLIVILLSPEFADPANRKFKTPFRFAMSALRATGGETDGGLPMIQALSRLGEVPYAARTPAGFPEAAAHWIDPAALLERIGLAFTLASGRVRGTRLGQDHPEGVRGPVRDLREREAIAVALAAPEFQWA